MCLKRDNRYKITLKILVFEFLKLSFIALHASPKTRTPTTRRKQQDDPHNTKSEEKMLKPSTSALRVDKTKSTEDVCSARSSPKPPAHPKRMHEHKKEHYVQGINCI